MTVVPLYSQLCFIQMMCLWKSLSADVVDVWFDKLTPTSSLLTMILHVLKAHDKILKTELMSRLQATYEYVMIIRI